MQSCFSNNVEFHFITDPDELTSLIEKFRLRTSNIASNENNSAFGEKITMDCLILVDNVLGTPDNCKKFAEFLMVCRKYRYDCCFAFLHNCSRKPNLEKILPQTNIFNIFPSSVPYNTVAKILQSNCRQTTKTYVPARLMWLNSIFIDLANTDE